MKIICVLLFLLVYMSGCSQSNDETNLPPVFKSSIPYHNASDVSVSTQIEITFDEVITLADGHGIRVNDKEVEALAQLTKVILLIELEKNMDYHVVIPVGAVINTFGIPLAREIEFSFATEEAISIKIDANLVVTNPSVQAVKVYNFLKENYGAKSISSVQANVAWNINEAEWVKQHTGKYPALATMDYIHLPFSPANWIDYSDITFIEDWWTNNGLVGASWHWLVPKFKGSTGYVYNMDDYTYKPEETTFKAFNVLIEGTWENTVAMADLEKIAVYLKMLQEQNIPIIWRPLHEAAGNTFEFNGGTAWFWWGASGSETYKSLWKLMFDYFEEQGLNNLIWVWTTQINDSDFYPGDDYVDIIGRDIYTNANALDMAGQFKLIQEVYWRKMITLSELGGVSSVSDQWMAGARWSYFMPWYDYARTNDVNSADFTSPEHEYANAAWWTDAFNLSSVITRDQMPDLK